MLPAPVGSGVPACQNIAFALEQACALLGVDTEMRGRVTNYPRGPCHRTNHPRGRRGANHPRGRGSAVCLISDRIRILFSEYGNYGIVADIMQSADILPVFRLIQRIVPVVGSTNSAVLRSCDHKLQISSFLSGKNGRFCLNLRIVLDDDTDGASAIRRKKQG